MGGKSGDAPIIGYKYYLGVHFLWCHNPIDALLEVRADNRVFWSGIAEGEQNLSVDEEELFGETEGGISGTFRLEPGDPSQGVNAYLQNNISSSVPAFRGVVGFVLNRMYLGNNPYLKRWTAKFQRIFRRELNGTVQAQWFPQTAGIGTVTFESQAISIVVDKSGSMDGNRLTTAREATLNLLNQIRRRIVGNPTNDVYVAVFNTSVTSITRRNVTQADIDDIISWVNTNMSSASGGTSYNTAISGLSSFYSGDGGDKNRTLVFISDGAPEDDPSTTDATLDAITGLRRYTIGIVDDPVITGGITSGSYTGPATIGFTDPPPDLEAALGYIDNTPVDGIPTVDVDSVDSLDNFFTFPFESNLDMNPAHIVRECLTNDEWGLGYPEADIDDQSFEVAAYILWQERFGISLAWSQQSTIEDFIQIVLNHADATLYVDRITGKWTMRLIRGDYDIDDLDIVTDADIVNFEELVRTSPAELVNSVAIRYNDRTLRGEASLTVNNLAQITQLGQVVATTVSYPGIWRRDLANRVALRDLKSLSTPLFSGTIYLTRAAADGNLNPGDVFRINSPRYGLTGEVSRVLEIDLGNGMDNTVKVRFVQDVFGVGTEATIEEVEEDINEWEEVFSTPTAAPIEMADEEPYYLGYRRLGSAAYNGIAGDDPNFGFGMLAAGRSADDNQSTSTRIDDGSGYVAGPGLAPAPWGYLATEITDDGEENTIVIDSSRTNFDLDFVDVNDLVKINNEYFMVTATDVDNYTFTVNRAVIDTVPAWHSPGDPVLFFGGRQGITAQFTGVDNTDVKFLPNTGLGQYSEASAIALDLNFHSRSLLPYPPGNFQVNSSYDPIPAWTGTLTLSWAHRDRTIQTGATPEVWTEGNIGPEAGVTYEVDVYAYDLNGDRIASPIHTQTGITGTSATIDTTVVTDDPSYLALEVMVSSVRGGEYCWQSPSIFHIKDSPSISGNSAFYFNVNDASSLYTDAIARDAAQYDDEQIGSVTPQ